MCLPRHSWKEAGGGGELKSWRKAAYWFAHHGFLNLLLYSTPDLQPRGGTTHNDVGPFTSSINQENTQRYFSHMSFPEVNILGEFSQFWFLLPKKL